MTLEDAARLSAWSNGVGRIAVGIGLLASPKHAAGAWVGEAESNRLSTALLGRAVGIRDVVIGAATVYGLTRGHARLALVGAALTDAGDLGATLAAGDKLPEPGRTATLALIATGITGAAFAATQLD